MLGPVRAADLACSMGVALSEIEQTLRALEVEGFVVQGKFSPGTSEIEWCERRLLARIHRTTIARLRKEIEPVSAADYMRFLFAWHGLGLEREGPDFVRVALEQLEGFDAPAAAWEGDILPARVRDYEPSWLDALCLSGRVVWGRLRATARPSASPIKSSPISLMQRDRLDVWQRLAEIPSGSVVSPTARKVLDTLTTRGALFFDELVMRTGLLAVQTEGALAELVSAGLVTSDGFSGLRALLVDAKYRTRRGRSRAQTVYTMQSGGRWSLLHAGDGAPSDADNETFARILLRRYGVMFRRLADRENLAPPWRDLAKVYRRLEARGEVRGGRFVDGVWGEQFALPEAVAELRGMRRRALGGDLVSISASDPVNLTGILTPGDRVGNLHGNRVLYRDGVPIAVKDGAEIRILTTTAPEDRWAVEKALVTRSIPPALRPYLGKGVRG
jgi:ATP-dependent Lhr-like helicase